MYDLIHLISTTSVCLYNTLITNQHHSKIIVLEVRRWSGHELISSSSSYLPFSSTLYRLSFSSNFTRTAHYHYRSAAIASKWVYIHIQTFLCEHPCWAVYTVYAVSRVQRRKSTRLFYRQTSEELNPSTQLTAT